MTTRTKVLLGGLAVFLIVLVAFDWSPLRLGLYLLGWAAVAAILTWTDRRRGTS